MMGRLAQGVARFLHQNWLVLLIVVALAVAFLVLRTQATAVTSVAEVDAILAGGQPALLEFYSNA